MSPDVSRIDVERTLRERNFALLREALVGHEPADVADLIEELDAEERALVFRVLPRELAADVFEHLTSEAQEGLIHALAQEHVAAILADMSPDDRTALLEELPATVTRTMLALLPPEERSVARQLLGYPEDSIGRLMTPDFVAVRADMSVREALDHIRHHGRDSETLNLIYVVDERGKLVDDLRVRQLLLADPDARISSIADGQFIALRATDDQERAVDVFMEYDRVAFPVTDSTGALLGIVTVDDVLDVAEEEATEDIQKIGGSVALEQPYMQASFVEMLRKRAGWLVLLFLGQQLTLTAMGLFTERMAHTLVLALFVPLIISSGGNSGSQAATLVIRALALDELSLADWWRVMRREIVFGLTMGGVLCGIALVRIAFDRQVGADYGSAWAGVALVVGLSLVAVVMWGVVIGSMLPFVLRRFGLDPAAASAPFVATLADVTGLVIYFTIAAAILGK